MNLSCGSRTIKYLIFSFNFFFAITGIILIAVGASIHAYYTEYDIFLNSQYFSLPNLLIATGSLIFFICFLGCYGAIKNSWILLFLFSVFLGIIFIFEFSAGIAGYVLRDKTTNYLNEAMHSKLSKYQQVPHLWDEIQRKFQCCGVTKPEDWLKPLNNSLPVSCCHIKDGTIGNFTCSINNSSPPNPTQTTTETTVVATTKTETTTPVATSQTTEAPAPTVNGPIKHVARSLIKTLQIQLRDTVGEPYQVGCASAFGNWVKAHAVDIGAVCFTLAVLQLIGIGFACHLSQQLKKSYYST